MKKFDELISEALKPQDYNFPIITHKDKLGNEYNLWVKGGKVYLNNHAKMPHSLSSIAFSVPASVANGTAAVNSLVKKLALKAKSSEDLANIINKSKIGYSDWVAKKK